MNPPASNHGRLPLSPVRMMASPPTSRAAAATNKSGASPTFRALLPIHSTLAALGGEWFMAADVAICRHFGRTEGNDVVSTLRDPVLRSRAVSGKRSLSIGAVVVATALAASCRGEPNAVLIDLGEARLLAADLRVQFNKASDASDPAVLADTHQASIAFAKDP